MTVRTLAPALAWGLLTLLALAVGTVSLRYALPGMPFPMDLPSLQSAPRAFVVHAVSASLALMLGPLQLVTAWRTRFPALHRWVGRAYVVAIAVGWRGSTSRCPTPSSPGCAGCPTCWAPSGTCGARA
ncbi:MAG: DUF2306 domain-containing protein [Acidovorax sp.]|nr:MAG: DUF2306 domain-containing protein [Acidovorax sp.]